MRNSQDLWMSKPSDYASPSFSPLFRSFCHHTFFEDDTGSNEGDERRCIDGTPPGLRRLDQIRCLRCTSVRPESVGILDDPLGGLGPLGLVVLHEAFESDLRMVFFLGVTDLTERRGRPAGPISAGHSYNSPFCGPKTAGVWCRERPRRGRPRTREHRRRRRAPVPRCPAFEVTQHVGPGFGRFSMPVSDRDQFFGPVSPHAHDDQDTLACAS